MDSDPQVMRYLTGQGRTRDQVLAAHRLRLATAGPVPGQTELGYRLLRRYWRQGFASEGCRELLRHAFEDLGLRRVFGRTMTVNAASRATMAAVGMRYLRTFAAEDEGPPGIELGGVEYEITREAWAAAVTFVACPDDDQPW